MTKQQVIQVMIEKGKLLKHLFNISDETASIDISNEIKDRQIELIEYYVKGLEKAMVVGDEKYPNIKPILSDDVKVHKIYECDYPKPFKLEKLFNRASKNNQIVIINEKFYNDLYHLCEKDLVDYKNHPNDPWYAQMAELSKNGKLKTLLEEYNDIILPTSLEDNIILIIVDPSKYILENNISGQYKGEYKGEEIMILYKKLIKYEKFKRLFKIPKQ